jgi:Zn-dependent protease
MFFDLDPATLIARMFVLVVAFTVHEFAHAWTATTFGDETPRMNGRLTLNPLSHLDPMGSLLLLVAGFGWAKPVPVNPYALQRRSSSALMLVSLAGPLSNFLMAVVGAIPFRLGYVSLYAGAAPSTGFFPSLDKVLFEFILINLILLLFNLIPLAPLDGEKIAEYFFPPSLARIFDTIRPYGPVILIAVAIVGPYLGFDILGWILGPPLNALLGLLVG